MNTFEGRVAIENDDVPVTVDLDGSLRLSANGTEIGEWSPGEFYISDDGDGVYTITAENEILTFIPSQPDLFAHTVILEPLPIGRHEAPGQPAPAERKLEVQSTEADVEKRGLFSELSGISRTIIYMLAIAAVTIGVWAAIRVFA